MFSVSDNPHRPIVACAGPNRSKNHSTSYLETQASVYFIQRRPKHINPSPWQSRRLPARSARCGTTSRVWYKSKHNTQTRPLHQSRSRSVIAFLLRSMPYYGLVPFDARPYYGLISFAPAEIYGSVHALFRNFVNSHSSQTVLRFFISLAILIRQTPSTAIDNYQNDHNTNQVNQRSYYRNVQCKRE